MAEKKRYVKVQIQGGRSRVITVRALPPDWEIVSIEVIEQTEGTLTLKITNEGAGNDKQKALS